MENPVFIMLVANGQPDGEVTLPKKELRTEENCHKMLLTGFFVIPGHHSQLVFHTIYGMSGVHFQVTVHLFG